MGAGEGKGRFRGRGAHALRQMSSKAAPDEPRGAAVLGGPAEKKQGSMRAQIKRATGRAGY